MELPQPRPFETEGRKPTHDFMSLYNHPNIQQDPRSPSQGRYLKTHDFLQPLEREGKDSGKEDTNGVEILASEKLPPSAALPTPVAQHVFPGGLGTYTISHVSYFNQRVPKVEVSPMFTMVQADSKARNAVENSNCSSYAGRWSTWERPLQSSTNNHQNSFGCFTSPLLSATKSRSFTEMIRYAKDSSQDDDLDDDEDFSIKKESSSSTPKADSTVKADGNKAPGGNQKPNTPRSKHSATEQRRRSKINDRFQKLRQLIPNSDQKRDKASFLLEVTEYLQFLQEKVNKFESSCYGWNHEPGKLMNRRNNQGSAEGYMDQLGSSPAAVYSTKLKKNNRSDRLDMDDSQTARLLDSRPGMVNKAIQFPLPCQTNFLSPVLTSNSVPQVSTRQPIEPVNSSSSWSQTQPCPNTQERDLGVDAGTISISSVYSQGLLKTLTQALQSSGVDLSQASIKVQIELAKHRTNKKPTSSLIENNEATPNNQGTPRPRIDVGDDFDRNPKKAKTDDN